MTSVFKKIFQNGPVEASAPCRIDMGGTLDISTFYFPLRHYAPGTVNFALDLRTRVQVLPYTDGVVKISSKGFRGAEYPMLQVPMRHPLGLLFAVAAYFGQAGIHISVDSASPPQSGLGGSSAAAVALIASLAALTGRDDMSRKKIASLAHAIEGSVAGVACGIQDQLAAAYGGVNLWMWEGGSEHSSYRKKVLVQKKNYKDFEKRLLVAFCGKPHVSAQVNSKWVDQFLTGKYRQEWIEIIGCTQGFAQALVRKDLSRAIDWMNKETAIRRRMTPEVLDATGKKLVRAAIDSRCGARFTGAGGGGCIWAMGGADAIEKLKGRWQRLLKPIPSARLLNAGIDALGVVVKH